MSEGGSGGGGDADNGQVCWRLCCCCCCGSCSGESLSDVNDCEFNICATQYRLIEASLLLDGVESLVSSQNCDGGGGGGVGCIGSSGGGGRVKRKVLRSLGVDGTGELARRLKMLYISLCVWESLSVV